VGGASGARDRADLQGERLGSYQTLLELASGGMGAVYVAHQAGAAGFERLVVIKRVHPHLLRDPAFHDMILDEARLASQIRHPNVVPVDDVVEQKGELLLVQPYVESVSLAVLLAEARARGERLPCAVVARIGADALAGLAGAHEAVDLRGTRLEIVHRDVSPQNIVVGTDGTSRIIDFGIAKAARRVTVTNGGVLKGKFAYMAPEQFRQQPVDARVDVFAAGVVLYEALTGERPFEGNDEADTMLSILIGDPTPASALASDVQPELDAVLAKALAHNRDARFASAAEAHDALVAAVKLAPTREVAQWVERLCGETLERRRADVRAALEASPHDRATLEAAPGDAAVEASRRSGGADTSTARVGEPQAEAAIDGPTVVTDEIAAPRGRAPRALVGLLGLVGALLVGLVVHGAGREPSAGAPPTARAGDPSAASASPAAPEAVTLSVRADAPIESVRADGLRVVELDGAVARLVVAPWTGSLLVEAVLHDGTTARARVELAGSHEAHLEPVDAEPATTSSPRPASSAAASPRTPARPRPSTSAEPRQKPSELHENPYNLPRSP
jgi:serine/threonine-protein kinase